LVWLWFDLALQNYVNSFCNAANPDEIHDEKFHWRTFHSGLPCLRGRSGPPTRRAEMAWKTPKIVEVPVGMEINMYACAARK
jgi:coenzyme PQQ precursor peptide PqqA